MAGKKVGDPEIAVVAHLADGQSMSSELHGELTMALLLERYPGARRALFSAFHIGGCQSCAYQDEEKLADVCARNELDLTEALRCLEESQRHDEEMLKSPKEVEEMLASDQAPQILDVRTREEFEGIPFPGAEFMTQDLQSQLFSHGPEVGVVILVDHLGRDVLDQCAWFRGHGLKETYGLEGGIDRWAQQVDPTIRRYRLEMT